MDLHSAIARAASLTATAASASTTTTKTSTTADDKTTTSTTAKGTFSELFTAAKADLKDGETLKKVDGHRYARIDGGDRDDEFINLSGNIRSGQAFELITRNGHAFHSYGEGKDRVIVGMGAVKDAASTTTSDTAKDTSSPSTTGSETTR